MKQIEFAQHATKILKAEDSVIGLAVGGSWITKALDEYSDLDLVIVTRDKVGGRRELMLEYARKLGDFISGFTGEHVGEPRLLICLYDEPLLHVDLKFVVFEEFGHRVEDPVLLIDKDGSLQNVLDQSDSKFPYPDYQWIEDRFWTWIHYTLLKIGRGEYLEALESLSFLRTTVLGPLAHIKQGNQPRGVRKVETMLEKADLDLLLQTVPSYDRASLLSGLKHAVSYYRQLRRALYKPSVTLQTRAEEKAVDFFKVIEANKNKQ